MICKLLIMYMTLSGEIVILKEQENIELKACLPVEEILESRGERTYVSCYCYRKGL